MDLKNKTHPYAANMRLTSEGHTWTEREEMEKDISYKWKQ